MKIHATMILVAALGLLASAEARANGFCGLRSDKILTVEDWRVGLTDDDAIAYMLVLRSQSEQAIATIGGSVEFFDPRGTSLASIDLSKAGPVPVRGRLTVSGQWPKTDANDGLAGNPSSVTALACVDSLTFADGSGLIIN